MRKNSFLSIVYLDFYNGDITVYIVKIVIRSY